MTDVSGESVAEAVGNQSQLASSLRAAVGVISQNQTVTFTKYVKLVLPLDGYVFWVKASLVSASALANVATYNAAAFNAAPTVVQTAPTVTVSGSLHIATTNQQDADESFSVNRMVFTATESINDLNDISPMVMYLAEHGDYRFSFSERKSFYKQADLYHYEGDAVYPVMESQIIDDVASFDTLNVIVSNSLPIWLALNAVMPVFPAFLVPDNIRPPYASVRIEPDSTQAIQMAPYLGPTSSHWQLVQERVRITVYGLRNYSALDYLDYILAQSLDGDTFGIMNSPVPRDEHRTQTELSTLAQKKSFDVAVNYCQTTARDIARQLILKAIPTFTVAGGVEPIEIPIGP